MRWIKSDLHLHTAEDPLDAVDYTALELLDRAHRLGFQALAVTLHGELFDDPKAFARARELGILLIPGVELRLEGADVVVLNISRTEAEATRTFADLRRLRAARDGSIFILAPHPFYVLGGSIGRPRLEANIDLFDAIEYCHFHVRGFNPNIPAVRLAARHHLPLLATSDAHRRCAFGPSHSLLEVPAAAAAADEEIPTAADVFAAIRAQRIQRVSPPYGLGRLLPLLVFLFLVHPLLRRVPRLRRWKRRLGRLTGSPRLRRRRVSTAPQNAAA